MDWEEDGIEPVEIEYVRGDLSTDEVKKYGSRNYYGYVIEVYWNDKLQDVKAEPPELADFAREMPPPQPALARSRPGNPLFPR